MRRGRSRASRSRPRCPGLTAGLALAWGRALGEFGATLMFAGSFRGVTQTVPLAIYERFSTDFTGALALVRGAGVRVGGAAARGQARVPCCGLRSRRRGRRARRRARGRRGRVPRAGGPLGRGQDDGAADRAGLLRPGAATSPAGTDVAGHRARRRAAARAPPLRLRVPGLRAVPAPQRVAQRRLRDRGPATARAGRTRCWSGSGWRAAPTPGRASCRAGSASASRSRARSRARPQALLLDEPLSALDARTRARAARELAAVLHETGVPSLLVTHDFTEAAQFGDRVGVIDRGGIVQLGTAAELAATPGPRVRRRLHRRGRADRRRAPRAATD